MTLKTAKYRACHWAALCLCCLTLPLLAQNRGGGGGGGGGGNAGRSSTAGSGTSTIDRPGNGQVGTANFYVDPDSRMLFVISDDATAGYVSNVVANLNRPKPQVLIKVVFLEVTYNKGMDVGVEASLTKRLNSSTSNTMTASSAFGLLAQGITPNSAGVNSLPGAGLYTIAGNDFSATLRAIEEVGKVEVLSRPSVLARNNQMAQIVVGEEVPLIASVTYDTFGNEHNAIQYQNVGIILQVTPFITSDGMVEMILAPQISEVDPSHSQAIAYTTNGQAITAPYIDIRSANTVVVTPDGQTVVIGGLMQNNRSTTDSKIPIIGDIPLIGQLFHHKLQANTKTELIILLTPYVVTTPTDLARMSQDERGRAQMSPKAFSQQEMNQYLGTSPSNAAPVAVPVGSPRPR